MNKWPERVWEMGDTSPQGKQLWYSREVTPEDKKRREKYDEAYQKRQLERSA